MRYTRRGESRRATTKIGTMILASFLDDMPDELLASAAVTPLAVLLVLVEDPEEASSILLFQFDFHVHEVLTVSRKSR